MKLFALISMTSAIQLGESKIGVTIQADSKDICETLPVFPSIMHNVDCVGAISHDASCTHKCGESTITSTCTKVMKPVMNDILIFLGVTKWEHR